MVRISTEMPLDGACAEAGAVLELARGLEDAGFAALSFTDHPAPSRKWLEAGGHPTYDPFAALAFCAAVTNRIGLHTHLVVLPYRNPLVVAKSVATVDRLSGGRLTVAVGTGYLRSEFQAVGRSFDERNALVEEGLQVLVQAFAETGVSFEGRDFAARDQIVAPGPIQQPHPPIWIGGGSRRARERVARWGDGWTPMLAGEDVARVTRTAPLSTLDDVERALEDLHRLVAAAGRDPAAIAVQIAGAADARGALARPDEHASLLERLDRMGVTDLHLPLPRDSSPAEVLDVAHAYSEAFIPSTQR